MVSHFSITLTYTYHLLRCLTVCGSPAATINILTLKIASCKDGQVQPLVQPWIVLDLSSRHNPEDYAAVIPSLTAVVWVP